MHTITIANAQGFWGDSPMAPARLVAAFPQLDYLTLDYLAEVSMSILAMQRERDPNAGYARDFVGVVKSLAPHWQGGGKTRIVANAGGLNPTGCAEAVLAALREAGLGEKRVAVVTGDDVLPLLRAEPEHRDFANWETGEALGKFAEHLVTANAYTGAGAVAEALATGADIVITGRTADPSMVVGACVHAFHWPLDDYTRLAGATIAGHLIECGTQVCGGIATNWLDFPDPADFGFPIVEVDAVANVVVTKAPGTGGQVTLETVKEQLLYEIGDPKNYLSPDCRVDFTTLQVAQEAPDRVRVWGATGSEPPATYKVSATWRDGWRATGQLTIFGRNATEKARRAGAAILERLRRAGCEYERTQVECLGANACAGGVLPAPELLETVLRISVADPDRKKVERFTQELMALVTAGPQGTTGYAGGRPSVSPIFSYWPCIIARDKVHLQVALAGGEKE